MSGPRAPTLEGCFPAWLNGSGPEADVVLATRVRIARNLAARAFPAHASPQVRSLVFRETAAAFAVRPALRAFSLVNFADTSPIDRQLLVEQQLASAELDAAEGDRGVAFEPARRISVMINEEDHLRLQCVESGCRPLDTWRAVDAVSESLGQGLDYAFEERLGFLTCLPADAGPGLRVSFLLHLPGLVLTKSCERVLQAATRMGMTARGFFTSSGEAAGSLFLLGSRAAMGDDAQWFLTEAGRTIAEVVACERRGREVLLAEARLELLDKIYRAYGILKYARTLSLPEFLTCTSALRLGTECGIFSKVCREALNRATLAVMPAHLRHCARGAADERELAARRAKRTREILLGKKNSGTFQRTATYSNDSEKGNNP